jgi:hypothetical protein
MAMSAKKLAKGIRSLQHVVKLKCSAGILDPEAKGLKEFYRRVSTEKLMATNDKCELSLELHHRDEVPKIEMEIGASAAPAQLLRPAPPLGAPFRLRAHPPCSSPRRSSSLSPRLAPFAAGSGSEKFEVPGTEVGEMTVMVNLRLQEAELALIDPELIKPYE